MGPWSSEGNLYPKEMTEFNDEAMRKDDLERDRERRTRDYKLEAGPHATPLPYVSSLVSPLSILLFLLSPSPLSSARSPLHSTLPSPFARSACLPTVRGAGRAQCMSSSTDRSTSVRTGMRRW